MMDVILCMSSNLFRMYVIYRFLHTLLGETEHNKKREIISYIIFYIVNTTLFLTLHLSWINLFCNLIGISLLAKLYTKSWKSNLFVALSIYILSMACDIFATLLFVNFKDGTVHNQIYATIGVFMIFICELCVEKIVSKRRKIECVNYIYHLSLILVPACSILILVVLTHTIGNNQKAIVITSFGILIINFLMFYFYNLLLKAMEEKYDNEILKSQLEMYAHQMEIIVRNEKQIKALRHDMKHHMNELKLLARKGSVVEIEIEQNRCAMACQGCGIAIFCFL